MYLKKYVILVLVSLILFSGCAYFNTFYNAKKHFNEAQEIPLDQNGRPQSNAIQKYNKAIKKCGIILTDYKNSRYADDALFLLAKSLFYKGTNYTQSIEKFQDIIEFYPESEFVPESKIYIARANYKFNNKQLAYHTLQEFINDPQYKKYHPSTLTILANYHLNDKELVEANYYLQKIIDTYPDSKEYKEAFFLQGKTYHIAQNFPLSNEVFYSLLKSRVEKKYKLEARYYISYNYLLLEEYNNALDIISKLLKEEYRTEHIAKIKLIQARCLSGLTQIEAIQIFEEIIKNNSKSAIAAEASFYFAELYLKIFGDYEKAIEYYNNVNKEYKNSEFIETALSRSVVAAEIIQYNNPDANILTEDLVNQQFRLAEYYIEVLDLPDSALSIYNNIISQKEVLILTLDSLKIKFKEYDITPDSLNLQDSLSSIEFHSFQDSFPEIDTIFINIDSLFFPDTLYLLDSLALNDTLFTQDSLLIQDSLYISDSTRIDTFKTISDSVVTANIESIKTQINRIEQDITKFDDEFIPFALFIKIWLYKSIYTDSLKANEIYQQLQNEYPENKYTFVAYSLLTNQDVEIITPRLKQETEEYNNAIKLTEAEPYKAIKLLEPISENTEHEFNIKATYTIGYIYYFILNDSTSAKPFLDKILEKENVGEYKTEINKFYNGKNFILLERLPYITSLEEAEQQETSIEKEDTGEYDEEVLTIELEEESDSLKTKSTQDTSSYLTPIKIISRIDPILPAGITFSDKEIFVNIFVSANGETGEITILDEMISNNEELSEIIRNVILQWEFLPATFSGEPIDSKIDTSLRFKQEKIDTENMENN